MKWILVPLILLALIFALSSLYFAANGLPRNYYGYATVVTVFFDWLEGNGSAIRLALDLAEILLVLLGSLIGLFVFFRKTINRRRGVGRGRAEDSPVESGERF